MPKRKRSSEFEVGSKLEELEQELFRALKTAKGFERQRLSKRVHSEQAQDKIKRLELEIAVLKVRLFLLSHHGSEHRLTTHLCSHSTSTRQHTPTWHPP